MSGSPKTLLPPHVLYPKQNNGTYVQPPPSPTGASPPPPLATSPSGRRQPSPPPLYLQSPHSVLIAAVTVATFVAVLLTLLISAIGTFGPFGKGTESKILYYVSTDSADAKETLSKAKAEQYAIPQELSPWIVRGERYKRFQFTNNAGVVLEVTSLGATITAIKVPSRHKSKRLVDIVLGFDTAREYLSKDNPYFGNTVGRVTNRIAGAKFSISDEVYHLSKNEGENHLHGGAKGFNSVNWKTYVSKGDNSVTFSHLSFDCDQGYPGDLLVSVTFALRRSDGSIDVTFKAAANRPTPINLSNHAYFNLGGHKSGNASLYDHVITVNADKYNPVDAELIPTGTLASVGGTRFDLRVGRRLRDRLRPEGSSAITGFDHNFALRKSGRGRSNGLSFAGRVDADGRFLEVFTDQPGLQLYTGDMLPSDGLKGKDGAVYFRHAGMSLESQIFPNAVNTPEFGLKSVWSPGEVYEHKIIYRVGNS